MHNPTRFCGNLPTADVYIYILRSIALTKRAVGVSSTQLGRASSDELSQIDLTADSFWFFGFRVWEKTVKYQHRIRR